MDVGARLSKIIRNMRDIEEGLTALLQRDPRLVGIAEKAGPLPLRLSEPGFSGLAHIIVSQVVSRASADAIWRRMEAAMGAVTASRYLETATIENPGFGLSRAKAKTLHGVATAIVDGNLNLETMTGLDDAHAYASLTALNGIGPWTAQVYLMFCLGHADMFPSGDVALQAAVAHGLQLDTRPGGTMLGNIALNWSPYRSVAARLFWAYYAAIMRRDALPAA